MQNIEQLKKTLSWEARDFVEWLIDNDIDCGVIEAMEDYAEEMASVDSDENTSYYFDNVDECEEILDEEGYDLVAWARSGMSIAEMAAEAGRLGDKYTCIRELKKEREDIIKYYVLRYAEMYEYTVDEDALDDIGVYYDLEEIREMTMWKKEALKHEEVRN